MGEVGRINDTFQNRLNEAINIRGIKPIELSEKTEISKSRISRYMSGLYKPKSKATYAIAKALNVSEAWLMGLDVPWISHCVRETIMRNWLMSRADKENKNE